MTLHSQSADILIIGAGASGLAAAIEAAQTFKGHGTHRILILEKNDRPGRKLLATGNGRCNLTHLGTSPESLHGQDPQFAQPALDHFPVAETLRFFLEIGLPCREESEGRIYPSCQQAAAVLDVLIQALPWDKTELLTGQSVSRMEPSQSLQLVNQPLDPKNRWEISTKDGQVFQTDCVILATGGLAAPNLGSDGSGYQLAQNLGHHLVNPWPALVALETAGKKTHPLSGVRVEAALSLFEQNRLLATESGEILFTDYGLSGIPVLQISRQTGLALQHHPNEITVELDLLPELSEGEIASLIQNKSAHSTALALGELLTGLVHQKISRYLTRDVLGLTAEYPAHKLTMSQIQRLAHGMKHNSYAIKKTRDFSYAQVTAGGLASRDFNPETLESRLHPGLYAAGEVLDIDGDCGGYNLQWAWSSGRLAGQQAALSILQREHQHA